MTLLPDKRSSLSSEGILCNSLQVFHVCIFHSLGLKVDHKYQIGELAVNVDMDLVLLLDRIMKTYFPYL